MRLAARDRTIDWPRPPLVMGIVNLVADSFSGDGIVEVDRAIDRARECVEEGAEIIDIGAESARTNRPAIDEEEEAAQLCRFIENWHEPVMLSINTWRPAVARTALTAGGHILNDIGGLPDASNARICAETGAALVIMHSVGAPKVSHAHVQYDDVIAELDRFFTEKIALAHSVGVPDEAIILDPGIDFAKQRLDNLRILSQCERLRAFNRPVLLPVSRKTVIGEVLNIPDPVERDAGTIACIVHGMLQGVSIFRVHNVRAAVQAIRMIGAVETGAAPSR